MDLFGQGVEAGPEFGDVGAHLIQINRIRTANPNGHGHHDEGGDGESATRGHRSDAIACATYHPARETPACPSRTL